MKQILRRPITVHGTVIEQYSLDGGVSWQTLKGVVIATEEPWLDNLPIPRRRDKKCTCLGKCTHEYTYIRRGPANRRVRRKAEGRHTRDVIAEQELRHAIHSAHYGENFVLTWQPKVAT